MAKGREVYVCMYDKDDDKKYRWRLTSQSVVRYVAEFEIVHY